MISKLIQKFKSYTTDSINKELATEYEFVEKWLWVLRDKDTAREYRTKFYYRDLEDLEQHGIELIDVVYKLPETRIVVSASKWT